MAFNNSFINIFKSNHSMTSKNDLRSPDGDEDTSVKGLSEKTDFLQKWSSRSKSFNLKQSAQNLSHNIDSIVHKAIHNERLRSLKLPSFYFQSFFNFFQSKLPSNAIEKTNISRKTLQDLKEIKVPSPNQFQSFLLSLREKWTPHRSEITEVEVIQSNSSPPNQLKRIFDKLTPSQTVESVKPLAKIDHKLSEMKWYRVQSIYHKILQNVQLEDVEKINDHLDKMNRGVIHPIWHKVQALANLIQDPKAAWNVKTLAVATLIYLISPFDAIPDVIPFAGLADDAALIIAVFSTLSKEVEKYLIRQAENRAEIEIRKYNKMVKITLLSSIAAAVIAIVVQMVLRSI